jgi:DeoR/GlpR family transcriptional regulator of sugar metabolism
VAEVMRHSGRTDLSIVLTGGLRTPSDALVGPVADAAVRSMHVDLLFMGVHGMDERGGFTTPNLLEAETNRAMVRSARQLVVVADHTKWGIVGLSTIAALADADVLITDDRLSAEARATLSEHVGRLIVAGAVPAGDAAVA